MSLHFWYKEVCAAELHSWYKKLGSLIYNLIMLIISVWLPSNGLQRFWLYNRDRCRAL